MSIDIVMSHMISLGGVMLHLSLVAGNSPTDSGIPLKVSKLYGDCTVIEIDDANGGLKEIDFATWYNTNRSNKK